MLRFVKNTLITGLVILIPVVLVFLTLRELLEVMVEFATPIADLFPPDFFIEGDPVGLIAVALIVLTAFLLGLIWSSRPTRKVAAWLEKHTLERLPMYGVMKSLVSAFLDMEKENAFKPACLRSGDGSLKPVYVIEKHGDDMLVVMLPWTPTAFAGSVEVVPASRVSLIPITLDEFSLSLTHYGIGLSGNLKKIDD